MGILKFGEALEQAKKGKLIARVGWNGKGMFVYQKQGHQNSVMKILADENTPVGVKDYFERKFQPITPENIPKINMSPYLVMKTADATLVAGWLASQTDMLAEDWIIVDNNMLF